MAVWIRPLPAIKRDQSRPRVSSNGLWLLATESHPHVLGHKILDFETLACDQKTVFQLW
jgi:hypothetical protein